MGGEGQGNAHFILARSGTNPNFQAFSEKKKVDLRSLADSDPSEDVESGRAHHAAVWTRRGSLLLQVLTRRVLPGLVRLRQTHL